MTLASVIWQFLDLKCATNQEAVEEAAMGQVDRSTLTPNQITVEKLIKEQNFTWKVCSSSTYGSGVVCSCLLCRLDWQGPCHCPRVADCEVSSIYVFS